MNSNRNRLPVPLLILIQFLGVTSCTFYTVEWISRGQRHSPIAPIALVLMLFHLLASPSNSAQSMIYRVDVINTWSSTSHPQAWPDFAPHFSWIGGATHNSNVKFWGAGTIASSAIIQMAESGNTTSLGSEVALAIAADDADQSVQEQHWFCPSETNHSNCGSMSFEILVSKTHPLVTLVTMLGPSPDWFVGTERGAIPKFDMAERPSLLRLEYEHPNERRKDS